MLGHLWRLVHSTLIVEGIRALRGPITTIPTRIVHTYLAGGHRYKVTIEDEGLDDARVVNFPPPPTAVRDAYVDRGPEKDW